MRFHLLVTHKREDMSQGPSPRRLSPSGELVGDFLQPSRDLVTSSLRKVHLLNSPRVLSKFTIPVSSGEAFLLPNLSHRAELAGCSEGNLN
ncbi:Hypothetical protein NTJ_10743 [Nesidiocoris tenuis]|uniref:Uncharacterized protein n=1 Tax=Nesidiocoris tenuis TaxID=355587 RepID=A0ABN7B115_9HEMI|nr:Hypothetical protein NTJ_10743 [Nesidiocoris tenuis]